MQLPLNKYPSLDVHGETRDTIYSELKIFIKDNIKMKNSTILIIHGKGSGILKNEVHYYLNKMKEVKSFHLHYWNHGTTIVELKI